MSSNPNRPDLPDAALSLERATIVGDALSQMVFGIAISLFLQAMYLLIDGPPRRHEKRNIPLISYTVVLFALGTVFVGMDLNSLKLMFVYNRNAPGGPTAYALSQYGKPITVVPNAAAIINDWLAAGFLLYRCVVIFHLNFAIVALPILMYLGSIAMSVMVLFRESSPHSHFWTSTTVDFGIPYYALSAALNVLITIMITTRLLLYRQALKKTLGNEHALSVPFASIASMLVESSVLYAATSILFLVPYGLKSDVSNIFIPILIQVQLLAPLLIILRVAKRRGWDKGTATANATSLMFQHNFPRSGAHTGTGEDNSDVDMERGDDAVSLEFTPPMRDAKLAVNELTPSTTGVQGM
ncbi:hypothetical protein B0H17DRAFT_1006214 [Mycena rosella]|uniref:Uncharacterized protein n=1 Tax=Mycena rosella TaxID=1033263 RepID=A0AAD7GQ58_MYCRO|nr:hypothetical protein B0H17DRAFT_1006214 [Mycena rosella]